jgi:O-antigen/teichoic acid export membrane protein
LTASATPLSCPPSNVIQGPPSSGRQDVLVAIRNAATLGGSLVLTWSLALGVRIFLPRYLGPAQFGVYNFTDAFAATAFVLVALGVDTYVHKEIPGRVEHASDFFGGAMLVRLAISVALLAGMELLLFLTHRSHEIQLLVFIFGWAQLFQSVNDTQASLLHAVGKVRGLAAANVVGKLIWGGAIVLGFALGLGLTSIALALLLSEVIKAIVLFRLVRRELDLRITFDIRAALAVTLASLPFFLNLVAYTAYAKVDVTMLSFLASDVEVGWYGAAYNIAGLALFISPLVGWVLLPLISRAALRSTDELDNIIQRSLEVILSIAIPISLFLALGADLWIRAAFGTAFAPATLGLRILAPVFILTYAAMVTSTCLIRLDRAWAVTAVSFAGLLVNPILNLVLITQVWRRLGPGGGGAGAAIALIGTETLVTTALLFLLGKRAFDRASVMTLTKTAGAAVLTLVAHLAMSGLGPSRLVVDLALYLALVIGSRALKPNEMFRLARSALLRQPQEA